MVPFGLACRTDDVSFVGVKRTFGALKSGNESRPSDFELEVIGFGGVTEMPACPCRKLDPDVLVVQAAQERHRTNLPRG